MSFEANICHFSYVFTVVRVFTVIFCLQTVLREKGPFGKGRRRKVILYSHLTLAKRISLGAKPNIALPQGEYSKKHGKSRAFFTNRARQSPAHAFSFFTITYYFQGRKGVFGEEIKIKAPKTCAFGTL